MASLGTASVHAKPVRHIHLIHAVSVKPRRRTPKRIRRTRRKSLTRAQRLYKQGKASVMTPPFSNRQIKHVKKLMRNRSFKNGVRHELLRLAGEWEYSKRGIKAHSVHFLANYYSYLYGNYHYRMGYLVGIQAEYNSTSLDSRIDGAKRNRSFWRGFTAGVYNLYGYRADFKVAKWEYQNEDKLFDDVAPPYSR